MSATYAVDVQHACWQQDATEILQRHGLCVLRNTQLQNDLSVRLNRSVQERLARLLAYAEEVGHNPLSDTFQFRELCKRMHPRRFDVSLPVLQKTSCLSSFSDDDLLDWKSLHDQAHVRAWPVLQHAIGASHDCEGWSLVEMAGCVVSLPGSEPQKYHQDGSREGQYNVFMPLVSVSAENGPTEFYPGSHKVHEYNLLFDKPDLVAPCLSLGDMLIFDYRILHRGLGNMTSSARPVAYLVYSRPGVSDRFNFPETSIFADSSFDLLAMSPNFAYLKAQHICKDDQEIHVHSESNSDPNLATTDHMTEDCDDEDDGLAIPMFDMESDIFGDTVSVSEDVQIEMPKVAIATKESWWGQLPFNNLTQKKMGVADGGDRYEVGGSACEYCTVEGFSFIAAKPLPILDPIVVCSSDVALNLLSHSSREDLTAAQLCGNELPEGASPVGHVYCGFQFGEFAGQLGDGAAISLGEVVTPCGLMELHLKGSGRNRLTRWWNNVTGRKTLGAMVREFIIAEALFQIGVPTTRALAVVHGQPCEDKLAEGSALLLRAADTFLRFGSLEIASPHDKHHRSGPSPCDWTLLRRLADHCIDAYYPQIASTPASLEEEDVVLATAPRYRAFLFEVTRRTARLAAAWQCLGAVHGMLNTDNISITGVTLDHGSFGFMGAVDGSFAGRASASSDRYCFRNQPAAAKWACERLSETLMPLHCTDDREMQTEVAAVFDAEFQNAHDAQMRQKLGLSMEDASGVGHKELISDLFALMESSGADWTSTFRTFTDAGSGQEMLDEITGLCTFGGTEEAWGEWLTRYMDVISGETTLWEKSAQSRLMVMASVNPKVVPRQWILDRAEHAAARGDFEEVMHILHIVTKPFEVPKDPAYASSSPPIAKIDPSLLGSMGPKVVELVEDSGFWQALCPKLHVTLPVDLKSCLKSACFDDARIDFFKSCMVRDGLLMIDEHELLLDAREIELLADAVAQLAVANWPATFIWVYSETWTLLGRLSAQLRQIMGLETSFDLSAVLMEPSKSWLSPHRDRPLDSIGKSFRSDGRPLYATCWIPLRDVPQTGSCLMCVPKPLDDGYARDGISNPIVGLHQLDRVRSLSSGAGSACILSHRLFYWGKVADALATDGSRARPCAALSIAIADQTMEAPRLQRQVLPLPPLQLRVALCAGQALISCREGLDADMCELMWGCFLAFGNHFSADFKRQVWNAYACVN